MYVLSRGRVIYLLKKILRHFMAPLDLISGDVYKRQLLPSEVAQIKDVITSNAQVSADNITIVPVE